MANRFADDAPPSNRFMDSAPPAAPQKDDSLSGKIGTDADKHLHNELGVITDNLTGKDSAPLTILRTMGQAGGMEADLVGDAVSEVTPGIVKRGAKDAAEYVADTKAGRAVGGVVSDFSKAHPQTAKALGAATEAIGGPAALEGVKVAPKAINAVAGAAKGIPGKAVTSLAGDAKSALAVKPVDADIAKIVKDAEKDGIKVPTAGLLKKGSLLSEHANVSGMKEYTESVNKKAADLIGANEGGGKFTVVNEQALNAANKRVSDGFDNVTKEIGKVQIGKPPSPSEQLAMKMHNMTPPENAYTQIAKIVSGAAPSDRTAWKRIVGDAQSMVDADGNMEASSIKKLISYNSDLAKKARSTASDAGEAQKVIGILKGQLYNAANDAQKATLTDLDHKYKLIIAFDKAGTRIGAGQTHTPEKIRDVLDTAYKESGENQYPARQLKTLLDTLHPPAGSESSIRGLTDPKLSAGVNAVGNPLKGSLAGRVLEFAPSKVASGVVNRPKFREKLLGNEAIGAVEDPLAAKPKQLPAPEKREVRNTEHGTIEMNQGKAQKSLPSPESKISGEFKVNSKGEAERPTIKDAGARLKQQQRDKELGISPDIRKVISERLNDAAWNDMTQQQQERIAQEIQKAWAQNKAPISEIIKRAKDFSESLAAAKGEKLPSGPMSQIYNPKAEK